MRLIDQMGVAHELSLTSDQLTRLPQPMTPVKAKPARRRCYEQCSATPEEASRSRRRTDGRRVVNNFSLNIATINGSGSQTSNGVLLRALFKMGIPVTGKNLFPSNIQGLPTWYIIRLSKDGYLAHRDPYEIAVCMNGRTVAEDMAKVAPGGIVLYDDTLPIAARRADVTYYPMPVGKLVKEANLPFELQRLHRQYGLRRRAGPHPGHRHGRDRSRGVVELRAASPSRPQLNMDMVNRRLRLGPSRTW